MTEYPEHEKLGKVSDRSQAIGEFLDWLQREKGVVLAKRHEHDEGCEDPVGGQWCGLSTGDLLPASMGTTKLLAEFYDIDLQKLDDEKRAMLEEIRQTRAEAEEE